MAVDRVRRSDAGAFRIRLPGDIDGPRAARVEIAASRRIGWGFSLSLAPLIGFVARYDATPWQWRADYLVLPDDALALQR